MNSQNTKQPSTGVMCVNITLFGVAKDPLSPLDSGSLVILSHVYDSYLHGK